MPKPEGKQTTGQQARTAGHSQNAVRAGPRGARRHGDMFLPTRSNYIEGTKMLAAYLYEVSQLKA